MAEAGSLNMDEAENAVRNVAKAVKEKTYPFKTLLKVAPAFIEAWRKALEASADVLNAVREIATAASAAKTTSDVGWELNGIVEAMQHMDAKSRQYVDGFDERIVANLTRLVPEMKDHVVTVEKNYAAAEKEFTKKKKKSPSTPSDEAARWLESRRDYAKKSILFERDLLKSLSGGMKSLISARSQSVPGPTSAAKVSGSPAAVPTPTSPLSASAPVLAPLVLPTPSAPAPATPAANAAPTPASQAPAAANVPADNASANASAAGNDDADEADDKKPADKEKDGADEEDAKSAAEVPTPAAPKSATPEPAPAAIVIPPAPPAAAPLPPTLSTVTQSGNEDDPTEDPAISKAGALEFWRDMHCDDTVEMNITAVDLRLLVCKLTHVGVDVAVLQSMVLMTHSNFVSSHDLLWLLEKRYDSCEPNLEDGPEPEYLAQIKRTIQRNVILLLDVWMAQYAYDFVADNVIDRVTKILAKARTSADPGVLHDAARTEVQFNLARRPESRERRIAPLAQGKAPPSIILRMTPHDFHPTQFHALEVARQLTLLDSGAYLRIQPSEYLKQAWCKEAKARTSPHLLKFIERFNHSTSWAATEILKRDTCESRAEMICFLLDVCENLISEQCQNFNSFMAILSALQSASISRLQFTWQIVPANYMAIMARHKDLMSMSHNYRNYRQLVKNLAPPVIPFPIVYLADLTFIDDGNPSKKETSNGCKLVNIEKERMTAAVIQELQGFGAPYQLVDAPPVSDYLLKAERWDEKTCYNASLAKEPRGMKAPWKKDTVPVVEYRPQEGSQQTVVTNVEDAVIAAMFERMQERNFKQGEFLMREGEMGQEMFYVTEGVVTIDRPDGTSFTTGHGQFFGEIALFQQKARTASIWAQTDVKTLVLTRAACDDMLEQLPQANDIFIDLGKQREARDAGKPNWMNEIARKATTTRNVDDIVRAIRDKMRVLSYTPNDCIIRRGDQGQEMYFIKDGICDLEMPDGRIIPFTKGQFFGEVALFMRKPRTATIRAQTRVTLLELSRQNCERILKEDMTVWKEFKEFSRQRAMMRGKVPPPAWMETLAHALVEAAA